MVFLWYLYGIFMVFIWYLHRRKNDGTSKFYPMYFPMTKSTDINFFLDFFGDIEIFV